MSKDTTPEDLQKMLNALHAHIQRYVREERSHDAKKNYDSTRDYALGDTVVCNRVTALDNCEQIKNFMAPGTPREVFDNIEKIEAEIRRLDRTNKSFLAEKWWLIVILATVGYFIYFVMTHR